MSATRLTRALPTTHPWAMKSHAFDRLLLEVKDSSSRSVSLAPAECAEVAQAKRVSENDWRLTLKGTTALADRLEAVVQSADEAEQGTCRTLGPHGRNNVRMEIGCRGPQLLASLLETIIEDHAATHPEVRLLAMLQVDDSMRPRRIDVLVPSSDGPQIRSLGVSPAILPAQLA